MADVPVSDKEKRLAEDAVRDLNRQYPDNKNYAATVIAKIGKTTVYRVHFTSQDGKEIFYNWVSLNGENVKAYQFLDMMLMDRDSGLFNRLTDIEYLKFIVTSALAIAFSAAVICIVMWQPDNKSLQVITGLAGLTIGYLVGQNKGS